MADRYYVGAAGAAWNNNAHWSNVTGGAGGFSFPVAGDNAFLDAGSAGNGPTLTAAAACDQLDCTGFVGTFNQAGFDLTVATTLFRLVAGMTFTHGSGLIDFTAVAGVVAITCAGHELGDVRVGNAGAGATYQFQDAFNVLLDLENVNGVVDTNGQAVTIQRDLFNRVGAGQMLCGASIIEIQGTHTVQRTNALVPGTSQFRYTGAGGVTMTLGGTLSYYDIYVADAGNTTNFNLQNTTTINIARRMTSGTGTLQSNEGNRAKVFEFAAGTSGIADQFHPNPALTVTMTGADFMFETGGGGVPVVVELYPCLFSIAPAITNGQVRFSCDTLTQAVTVRAVADISWTATGGFSFSQDDNFSPGAMSKKLETNGFNISFLGGGVINGRDLANGRAWWFDIGGGDSLQMAAYGEWSPNQLANAEHVLGAGSSWIVLGNFTYLGGALRNRVIRMTATSTLNIGGNLITATMNSFGPWMDPAAIIQFSAAGAFTIVLHPSDVLPTLVVSGGGNTTLPNGFECENCNITAGQVVAGNPFTVRAALANAGTFTASASTNIGSSFINTGVFVGVGSNITARAPVCSLSGFNPVTLTMGDTCLRLQLQSTMTITTFVVADRRLPGVIQFLAGGTFTTGTFFSQIASTDGVVQMVSSTAGTTYAWNVTAAITSLANIWPRDCDAGASAIPPAGDNTNKNLGNNTGWTLITPGLFGVISEDAGQDLLAAGGIGPINYCWLVADSAANLVLAVAAFAGGGNNWHRKTNIPYAMLDNLPLGSNVWIAMGLVDDRDRRVAPGPADFVTGVVTKPESGGGGGGGGIVASPEMAWV